MRLPYTENQNQAVLGKTVALSGNPNVGKSTVFNAFTGLKQHTGNWPGKTVANAVGYYTYDNEKYTLIDLPGTYSLISSSKEEEIARDYICSGAADAVIIVADATCLERNLNLALQILELTSNCILCINLIDEAKKKGINIDFEMLESILGIPVVGICARERKGMEKLKSKVKYICDGNYSTTHESMYSKLIGDNTSDDDTVYSVIACAEEIAAKCITYSNTEYASADRKADKILTSKIFGVPIMICMLGIILYLSIAGANYPSALLASVFTKAEEYLFYIFTIANIPDWITNMLIPGMYRTLAQVVSVMLPPMAIFFPLFTIFEDSGYLPRIAFNLDGVFKKCCAHGKQCLTMCMGLGCNAAGVTGARIIDSPRERLIAILTNSLVPCNGRFPTLITVSAIFSGVLISGTVGYAIASICVLATIVLGILTTFGVSYLLSKTILKGQPSQFTLELPPYRKPKFGEVIYRSIFDRTIFVLGRAVAVAAPAGAIIWLAANVHIGNISLLNYLANFFNPFAKLLGLDGYILLSFILGLPANEIVMPILIMCYTASGHLNEAGTLAETAALLSANGWNIVTAVNMMLFTLFHFPCATTLWTIKKETGSIKWTLLAFAIPTAIGIILCIATAQLGKIFIA